MGKTFRRIGVLWTTTALVVGSVVVSMHAIPAFASSSSAPLTNTATTSLGDIGPTALVVDDADQHVFIAGATTNTVDVSTFDGQIVDTIPVADPQAMVIAGSSLYVDAVGAGTIEQIDLATLTDEGSLVVGLDLASTLVYANGELWTFSVDPVSNQDVLTSITLDGDVTTYPGVTFPDADLFASPAIPDAVFVTNSYNYQYTLYRVDVSANPAIATSTTTGGATNLLISPDGTRLIGALSLSEVPEELDPTTLQPDGVTYPSFSGVDAISSGSGDSRSLGPLFAGGEEIDEQYALDIFQPGRSAPVLQLTTPVPSAFNDPTFNEVGLAADDSRIFEIVINPNTEQLEWDLVVLPLIGPTSVAVSVPAGTNPQALTEGGSVPVTAAVTANGDLGPLTGTVTLSLDGTPFSTVPVQDGRATADLSIDAVGQHTVTAAYNGDADNTTSTGSLSVNVEASTSTALSVTPSPAMAGGQVTLTARVSGVTSPTGNVEFYVDGSVVTSYPVGDGSASVSVPAPEVGSNQFQAVYEGDSTDFGSSSPTVDDSVDRYPSTSQVTTISPVDGARGGRYQFAASVFSLSANAPSGTVTFYATSGSSTTEIGTAPTAEGQGEVDGTLPAGSYHFTAVYSGDADTLPSSSPAFAATLQEPAATTTPTPTPTPTTSGSGRGEGYWLTGSNGAVYGFGTADNFGSTANHTLSKPVVGMASTPDGKGYWLVASDGGIFAFGDAGFYGSTGAVRLNKPVVGMASTPDGKGYWLVASDGGIFAFGDAGFYGSTGAVRLNKPVVGMASTPDGKGYWLVASDGGTFSFGDATYLGSESGHTLGGPIIDMAAVPKVAAPAPTPTPTPPPTSTATGGPPSLSSVTPASGPTSGRTVAKIYGTDLAGASEVTFGGRPAASFEVGGSGEITAVSPLEPQNDPTGPLGQPGVVDIRVTVEGVTSATTPADSYSYTTPTACTDTWVGAADSNWSVAANWSTGSTPDAYDYVCIPADAEHVPVQLSTAAAAGTIDNGGGLAITGSLVLTGTSTAATSTSPGPLAVTGTLQIDGTLNMSGALYTATSTAATENLAGPGTLTLTAGGDWAVLGNTTVDGPTITDAGQTTIANGTTLEVARGGFNNSGDLALDSSATIDGDCPYGYPPGAVANTGTISLEGPTATIGNAQCPLAVDNSGAIDLGNATLSVPSGGDLTELAGSSITGAGLVTIGDGGRMYVDTNQSIANLDTPGGTIGALYADAPAVLTVTNSFVSGGEIEANLSVAAGAAWDIDSGTVATNVTNNGEATVAAGASATLGYLTNVGSLTLDDGSAVSASTIVNAGTLSIPSTATAEAGITNEGSLVIAGSLNLTSGVLTLEPGDTVTATGTLTISGIGGLNVDTPTVVPNLNVSSSQGSANQDIEGNSSLMITGTFTSGDGELATSAITVAPGGTWNVTGYTGLEGEVTNDGTATVANLASIGIGLPVTAITPDFNNIGTILIDNGGSIGGSADCQDPEFYSTGTIELAAGATGEVGGCIDNSGTLDLGPTSTTQILNVQGTLDLNEGTDLTGAGEISGLYYNLDEGGVPAFGTIDLNTPLSVSDLAVSNAYVELNAPVTAQQLSTSGTILFSGVAALTVPPTGVWDANGSTIGDASSANPQDESITNDGTINLGVATQLYLANFTNNGTLTMGSGSGIGGQCESPMQNFGSITLDTHVAAFIGSDLPSDVSGASCPELTNTGPITVGTGTLELTAPVFLNAGSALTGDGTVAVGTDGDMVVDTPLTVANLRLRGGSVGGPDDLTATDTIDSELGPADQPEFDGAGTTTVAPGGLWTIDSIASIGAGTVDNQGTVTFSSYYPNYDPPYIDVAADALLINSGTIAASGPFTADCVDQPGGAGVFDNTGTLSLAGAGSIGIDSQVCAATFNDTGTIALGTAEASLYGALNLETGSTVTGTGTITVQSGSHLTASSDVTVPNLSQVPDDGPVTSEIEVDEGVTLSVTDQLALADLHLTAPSGSGFGQISVGGAATLAGSASLYLDTGSTTPACDTSVTAVTASSVSNGFSMVSGSSLPAGGTWQSATSPTTAGGYLDC
jgi:hypothetical protein